MFLRDNWYVAALGADVPQGAPVARTILGEPIALYRTASGTVAALEDRCSHRAVPLTAGGECHRDVIQCPYHGLEFGPDGTCRHIPSQTHIPSGMHIRSYPIIEQDGFVWIWMGNAARKTTPPQHPWNDHPEWSAVKCDIVVDGNWQLFNDNLLDLSHLGFVHKRTIGGDDSDAHAASETVTTRDGNVVKMRRSIPNVDPPPFYRPMADWKGRIDRWQDVDFIPGYLHFYVGGVDCGTGALEGVRVGGVQFHHLYGITPIDEHHTRYTISIARHFCIDDAELDKRMESVMRATLAEDIVILEAQQKMIDRNPGRPLVPLRSDGSGVQARRVVEDMAALEASPGADMNAARLGDLAPVR